MTSLSVEFLGGETVHGRLLHATPDRLYLWVGPGGYRRESAPEGIRVVPLADVATVDVPIPVRDGLATQRLPLIAAALASAGYVLATDAPAQGIPALSNAAVLGVQTFWPPPRSGQGVVRVHGDAAAGAALARTLRPLAVYAGATPEHLSELPLPSPGVDASRTAYELGAWTRRRVHASLGGMLLGRTGVRQIDGNYATGAAWLETRAYVPPTSAWYADAGYQLRPRLRVGASGRLILPLEEEAWGARLRGVAVAPYAEFAVAPADPLLRGRRVAASVAAGPNLYAHRVGIRRAFTPAVLGIDPSLAEEPARRSHAAEGVGVFGRFSLDFYARESLSLTAQVSYRGSGPVRFPADERAYRQGNASGLLYRWEAFDVSPPRVEVFVGSRWHF